MSHLVRTDGSLFLILGLDVSVNSKSQTNDTTNASNNGQNVHIGYLLGIRFPRGCDTRLPFRPRGESGNRLFNRTPSTKDGRNSTGTVDSTGGIITNSDENVK